YAPVAGLVAAGIVRAGTALRQYPKTHHAARPKRLGNRRSYCLISTQRQGPSRSHRADTA
ncbi:MAG: hypothetical protein ACRDTS_24070, partial [Mycobacterium sp.]